MGLIDVDRSEAVAFGLISQNKKISPEKRPFNEGLESSVSSFSKALQEALKADSKLVIDQGVLRIPNRVAPLLEKLQNAGTSSGAIKGWASRRHGLLISHATPAPERMKATDVDQILTKGIDVVDASGSKINFGLRVKNYLDKKPDGIQRKVFFKWAMEAVQTTKPFKRLDRSVYVKVFEDDGKKKGLLVLTAINGEVFNFYRKATQDLKKDLKNKSAVHGDATSSILKVVLSPAPSRLQVQDKSHCAGRQVLKGDQ
jgi:hypothetical protein